MRKNDKMKSCLVAFLFLATQSGSSLPMMRPAPTKCPLENGNLLDVHLFITDEMACKQLCQDDEKCIFFHYYEGSQGGKAPRSEDDSEEEEGSEKVDQQPAQCFLYDRCSRMVLEATEECPLTKENTAHVEAFVQSGMDCKSSCSDDGLCGYYKYFPANDTRQPQMCYHLKKCSPRVIRRSPCPLEKNNYIDHYLFTKSAENCKQKCQDHSECRFYFWYPIDHSPAPLYCYLYRNCQGGSDEIKLGFAIAGRHPGHYFLGKQVSADEVRSSVVCEKKLDMVTSARGAAVAEYVDKEVLFCGGRLRNDEEMEEVRGDCLGYKPRTGEWFEHSKTLEEREEASSSVIDGKMYILGGIIDGKITNSSEVYETEEEDNKVWVEGPVLPEPKARSCAVAVNGNTLAIMGGETDSSPTSSDVKFYNSDSKEWTSKPDMIVRRKDHACAVVSLGEERGILVSGGVSDDDVLLDSVEFYSFDTESWIEIAHLKQRRTEHGMAVVSGLPTVIGGVSEFEFLSSIEVLDNSADEKSPYNMEWRLAAYTMSLPRYDFAMVTIPISAFKTQQRIMTECPINTAFGNL